MSGLTLNSMILRELRMRKRVLRGAGVNRQEKLGLE